MAFLNTLRILLLVGLAFTLVNPHIARALEVAPDATRIKALYLLNFASFAAWPENNLQDTRATIICSLGSSPLTRELKKAIKEYKATRDIVLRQNVPFNLIKHCHLLYIDPEQAPELATIFTVLKPYPVLTVSEIPDFVEKGGMIGLLESRKELGLYADKKITYVVNLKRALDVQLQLDPRLLELADRVVEVGK